jgi:single-strand DNA-binding protein
MSGWHQTIIVGHLGKEPQGKEVNGRNVCNFSVAVSEAWNDTQTGERREKTTWYDVSVWGAQATACYDHLSTGSQVMVVGDVSARGWTTESGEARASLKLNARSVQFLSSGKQSQDDYDESQIPF